MLVHYLYAQLCDVLDHIPSQPLLQHAELRFQLLDLQLRLGLLLSAGLQLCGDGDEREEEEERGEDGREGDWDVVRPGDDAHVAPRSARLRVERRSEGKC